MDLVACNPGRLCCEPSLAPLVPDFRSGSPFVSIVRISNRLDPPGAGRGAFLFPDGKVEFPGLDTLGSGGGRHPFILRLAHDPSGNSWGWRIGRLSPIRHGPNRVVSRHRWPPAIVPQCGTAAPAPIHIPFRLPVQFGFRGLPAEFILDPPDYPVWHRAGGGDHRPGFPLARRHRQPDRLVGGGFVLCAIPQCLWSFRFLYRARALQRGLGGRHGLCRRATAPVDPLAWSGSGRGSRRVGTSDSDGTRRLYGSFPFRNLDG